MKKSKNNTSRVPPTPIIPKETLEIVERREILISGVLGIEDYRTEKVRIKTVKGIVEADGSSLSLIWAGEKRLLLRGYLECIKFETGPISKGGCRPCR